ncbi:purine and uridine phosphorylase, partial [Aureobasidium melanogenum]
MLDKTHPKLPTPGDDNSYTFGEVHFNTDSGSMKHNVVLACLPYGATGKASAAAVAKDMERTFVSLKFGLMVGIAGGVWSENPDVRLGDIVVGITEDGRPGVIQYDHGKTIQDKELELKGTMNKAPRILSTAVSELQSNHLLSNTLYRSYLDNATIKKLAPRPQTDELYDMTYKHQSGVNCNDCDKSRIRLRSDRPDDEKQYPRIHYGVIASGDQVMRDAITAEKIRQKHKILCFEMEAAGLDAFKCLVIRGISDYADTHKNDQWHKYAAAAAVSYAKELLSVIAPTSVSALPTVENRNTVVAKLLPKIFVTDPRSDKRRLVDDKGEPARQSYEWIIQDGNFLDWRDNQDASILLLKGLPGKGKTMICIGLIDELQSHIKNVSTQSNLSFFFCQSLFNNLDSPISLLKGIIWLMIEQRPTLVECLARSVTSKGSEIFEGPNALHELWALFEDIVNTSADGVTYIVVDALDECDQGRLDILLRCIFKTADQQPRKVKWLLSSRPHQILSLLESGVFKVPTIDLEVNTAEVSNAVAVFIENKVEDLAVTKHYDKQLKNDMISILQEKAEDTFLWVSLVCKRLEAVSRHSARSVIAQFPKGLDPLYERMLSLLLDDEDEQQMLFCTSLIRSAILTWSPIHIKEIGKIAGLPREISDDHKAVQELLDRCGSFLKVSRDIVSFIHQSAREYLGRSGQRLLSEPQAEHSKIAMRCLEIMSGTLSDNMGALDLGSPVSEARTDSVDDVVARCGYSVCYWSNHFQHAGQNDSDGSLANIAEIEKFLQEPQLKYGPEDTLMGLLDLMTTDRKV